ncbi:MAG: hypothetical protein OXE92_05465 [Bacteroidetes bacterium]|nr:hypothetical protein [Bacteroidota bacterium]MCY4205158.1 hypothetical protein [Bacteroidota bacterium]
MQIEITLLHLIVASVGIVFLTVGILLAVLLPHFRRNEHSNERLEAKLDRSVERLEARIDHSVERLEARIDHSVEQLRSDTKQLEIKLEHSVEQLDSKLERFHIELYILNGKVSRLLGHVFGSDTQVEEDEKEEQIAVGM